MTDKELRHLSKGDLIEIIYQMKKNEIALQAQLQEATEKLKSRELKIDKAGSIAEASLRVNGVFEAAQKAANDYLRQIYVTNEKIKAYYASLPTDTKAKCRQETK